MGGEMIFTHNDKLIEDLDSYKKILKEMEDDCATTPAADGKICLITNPISNWNNGYVTKWYGKMGVGQDDDYELSVDLGKSTRSDRKFYVLFPKDPNKFKILSETHARGLDWQNKKWVHDYFLKFVTTFPGVFELYYGDGYSGFEEGCIEIDYRDGSNVPVRRRYPGISDLD